MRDSLEKQIEDAREQMIISAEAEGLSSENTIALSVRLDELLNNYKSLYQRHADT